MGRALAFLSVLVYCLLVLGGLVRNLGAGLSCPDWPLCFGKIIPHFDIRIFAEFFHRLVAGIVSLMTLALSISIFAKKNWRAVLSRQATLAVALLLSQVVLGGLTVLKYLQSEIVTLHLATGTLFFSVILVMTLRSYRFGITPKIQDAKNDRKRPEPTTAWRFGIAALAALYIQIIFGGVVSSHYAGLACPDFPTCKGIWWPGFGGLVGIHLLHRIGALLALGFMSAFIWHVHTEKNVPRHAVGLSRILALVLLVQLCLGVANVLLALPVALSVAHLAVAEALLGLIIITVYEIRHQSLS